jgi:hypothetical protein
MMNSNFNKRLLLLLHKIKNESSYKEVKKNEDECGYKVSYLWKADLISKYNKHGQEIPKGSLNPATTLKITKNGLDLLNSPNAIKRMESIKNEKMYKPSSSPNHLKVQKVVKKAFYNSLKTKSLEEVFEIANGIPKTIFDQKCLEEVFAEIV